MTEYVTLAVRALDALQTLPLECDGVSRSLSQVLVHAGVPHVLHFGVLEVHGVGRTPFHCWVVLPDGSHCDARARMWLGDSPSVPHGVFQPGAQHRYTTKEVIAPARSPFVFAVLTGQSLDTFMDGISCPTQ